MKRNVELIYVESKRKFGYSQIIWKREKKLENKENKRKEIFSSLLFAKLSTNVL